ARGAPALWRENPYRACRDGVALFAALRRAVVARPARRADAERVAQRGPAGVICAYGYVAAGASGCADRGRDAHLAAADAADRARAAGVARLRGGQFPPARVWLFPRLGSLLNGRFGCDWPPIRYNP